MNKHAPLFTCRQSRGGGRKTHSLISSSEARIYFLQIYFCFKNSKEGKCPSSPSPFLNKSTQWPCGILIPKVFLNPNYQSKGETYYIHNPHVSLTDHPLTNEHTHTHTHTHTHAHTPPGSFEMSFVFIHWKSVIKCYDQVFSSWIP